MQSLVSVSASVTAFTFETIENLYLQPCLQTAKFTDIPKKLRGLQNFSNATFWVNLLGDVLCFSGSPLSLGIPQGKIHCKIHIKFKSGFLANAKPCKTTCAFTICPWQYATLLNDCNPAPPPNSEIRTLCNLHRIFANTAQWYHLWSSAANCTSPDILSSNTQGLTQIFSHRPLAWEDFRPILYMDCLTSLFRQNVNLCMLLISMLPWRILLWGLIVVICWAGSVTVVVRRQLNDLESL